MQSIIEQLRQKAVENILSLSSMQKGWEARRRFMLGVTGNPPEGRLVLDLGDRMSDVFRLSTIRGRTQGGLSSSGIVWEGLVCWYCNLCLIGSRAVVIKATHDVTPQPLRKAAAVQIDNIETASEADLMAITFPDKREYTEMTERLQGGLLKRLNSLAEDHFEEYRLNIIQCKTNWNDSAQIPMLWDMVYNDANFSDTRVHVGSDGHSLKELKSFKYSFVTVPTGKYRFTPKSVAVARVSKLSGGNYWGREGVTGVASSIKQSIDRNFRDAFGSTPIIRNLEDHLAHLKSRYAYFDLAR